MNDLIQSPQRQTLNFFDPAQMESVQRAAKMFANSDLVPDMYKVGGKQQNPPEKAIANCVIAMNMASRMNADVLMIMQNLVIIYGRPSWSSTFLISSVNSSGRFEPLKYKFTNKGRLGKVSYVEFEKKWVNGTNGGKGFYKTEEIQKVFDGTNLDNIECIAYTKAKGSDEVLESSPISIEMAIKEGWYTKNGSKWQTMPQQMLMYRSASFWVRAYAPEISMGMYTVEETQDMNTVDAEFEVVETRVEKEIEKNANKEHFSMNDAAAEKSADKPAEKVMPKATAEEAFETATEAPADEMFPESNETKREF